MRLLPQPSDPRDPALTALLNKWNSRFQFVFVLYVSTTLEYMTTAPLKAVDFDGKPFHNKIHWQARHSGTATN